MIYKTIINYALAAGIALGAALTPNTASALPPLSRAETRITREDCQVLRDDQKEQCDKEYGRSKPHRTYHQCGLCMIDSNGHHCSSKVEECVKERTRKYNVELSQNKFDLKKCRTEADKDYQTCLKDNDLVEKKPNSYTPKPKANSSEREVCTKEGICSCQPAEKSKQAPKAVKKKLTIEEICAQQKVDAQSRCAYERDQNLAKTKEELWEEATRTGNYDDFGRIAFLEEANAHNCYSLCGIEARLREFECIKLVNDELARKAQAQKDAVANRIKTYEQCVKGCGKAVGDCYRAREKKIKEIKQKYTHHSNDRRRAFEDNDQDFFSCAEKAQTSKDRCLPKCGKNPNPEWQRGRIEGLGKIDTSGEK